MANERLGASFSIDVTELKTGLAQANRLIKESESEFKAAAAGMDDWRTSQEGLTAKVKSLNSITDLQRKKVDALKENYEKLIAEGLDPTSKEAVELRTKINKETEALNKNEKELKNNKEALENLAKGADKAADAVEETGKAAEKAERNFDGLKGIAGGVVGAIAGIAAACAGAVTAFFGLAESTRETRQNMAKLETAFESAGLTAEQAEGTFTELYSVLGDEGKATEAAQHLSKMSKDEKDLAANTRILTGVMAEYGDSIPTEGLAEAMAATSAMGSVQGNLADALEWQGVNLDDYNAKLASMSTEEERAAYIQKTLTDLYGASADAYMENNASIIEANKAQAGLNDALAELGKIAEPIMTTLKLMSTELLQSMMPLVSLVGEGLSAAFNGTEGAADKLAEGLGGILSTLADKLVQIGPIAVDTLVAVVPQLLTSLLAQLPSILSTLVALIMQLLPQVLSALLGCLPSILSTLLVMVSQISTGLGQMLPTLIPLIVDTVMMLADTCLDNIDILIDAGIALLMGLADGLLLALPRLIDKLPVIIDKLVSAFAKNGPKLIQAGIELIVKLAAGLVKAIPQLIAQLPQIIKSIVTGFASYYKEMGKIGKNLIEGLWNGIKDMSTWISNKIKGFGDTVLGGIKDFFGIHSPSKVMADEVGKNLALGIGQGFTDNIGAVNKMITGAMDIGGGGTVGNIGSRTAGGGVVVYQTNNYSQAHSRVELYKTKQATAAAVRLALGGV